MFVYKLLEPKSLGSLEPRPLEREEVDFATGPHTPIDCVDLFHDKLPI